MRLGVGGHLNGGTTSGASEVSATRDSLCIGWHPDSDQIGERYWDGASWTDFRIGGKRSWSRSGLSVLVLLVAMGVTASALIVFLAEKGVRISDSVGLVALRVCQVTTGMLGLAVFVGAVLGALRPPRGPFGQTVGAFFVSLLFVGAAVAGLGLVIVLTGLVGLGVLWAAAKEIFDQIAHPTLTLTEKGVTIQGPARGPNGLKEVSVGYDEVADVFTESARRGGRLCLRLADSSVVQAGRFVKPETLRVCAHEIRRRLPNKSISSVALEPVTPLGAGGDAELAGP